MSKPKINIIAKKEIPIKSGVLKNHHKVVEMIFNGYTLRNINIKKSSRLIESIFDNKINTNKSEIQKLLLHMSKNNINVLDDTDYVNTSMVICDHKNRWYRNPYDWKSKSYNSNKNLSDFIHYIFCKYDTPKFFDDSFIKNKKEDINLFFWIGDGNSVRKYPNLPVPLTKKMIFKFITAPKELTVEESFIWAHVMGTDGGNESLFKNLMGSKINDFGRYKRNYILFSDIIQFFARQGMMNYHVVSLIIDYIWYVVHEENPYFNTKNKTLTSLLRDSDEWHEKIVKTKEHENDYWDGFDIPNYTFIDGLHLEKVDQITYTITQIKNSKELIKEGRELRHCVSSYARDCISGNDSIWSLKQTCLGVVNQRLLTIQLSKNKVVNQVRGYANRPPNNFEWSIIQGWINQNNLTISRYRF